MEKIKCLNVFFKCSSKNDLMNPLDLSIWGFKNIIGQVPGYEHGHTCFEHICNLLF